MRIVSVSSVDIFQFDKIISVVRFLVLIMIITWTKVLGQAPNFSWVITDRVESHIRPSAMDIDNDANIIIGGQFWGNGDFRNGDFEEITQGGYDAFIQKIDSNGVLVWSQFYGTAGEDGIRCITHTNSNEIILSGVYSGTVDLNFGEGEFLVSSNGEYDFFVLKLAENGDFLWAKTFGSIGFEHATAIHVDRFGDILLTGEFDFSFDSDPGLGVNWLNSSGAISDVFLIKLDSNGNFLWDKTIYSNGEDRASAVKSDTNGNVFSIGDFSSVVQFEGFSLANTNGFEDIFIQKLDKNGNYVWTKTIGGLGYDTPLGLEIDSNQDLIVVGSFWSNVNFDPGQTDTTLNSAGGFDSFVMKLDNDGNLMWISQLPSNQNLIVKDVAVDRYNNIYTFGDFTSSLTLIPGETMLSESQLQDCFILKQDPNGVKLWTEFVESDYQSRSYRIKVDSTYNVYGLGTYNEIGNFMGSMSDSILKSKGNDLFLFRLGNQVDHINWRTFANEGFSVYPNPSTEGIYIIQEMQSQITISIYDYAGRICRILDTEQTSSYIDISSLSNGVYLVIIKKADEFFTKKVVKI